jgi:UDP-glucose:(heptosyl)LPS alpha-1,3-glucosyltransferase
LAFRRAAGAAIDRIQPATTLSFGANCPPGDVYWVQSVHRAWLENGGDVFFHGVRVPSQARKLLLRHQVLLGLEQDYFVNHHPRAILCTSEREVADLRRLYEVPSEILHVVPNGFDGSVFNPQRRTTLRAEMRHTIGATETDVVVLIVANEWHRKGLGTLLEAVAAAGDPRLRLDLVGARTPNDYRPLAERLGLADRMHWHGPSHDVARFHAAADAFALPTTYEPFGLVIIEAMASGLPVITTRLAGAATAITDGTNGLLMDDPRDIDRLSRHLTRLLDPAERVRMGEAASASVDDYEWKNVFARAEKLIFPPRP